MWHTSVRHPDIAKAKAIAFRELEGVGDPSLGQWEETMQSFHLRRRLSDAETSTIIPAMLDIRGTPEAWARYKALPCAIRKHAPGPW